MVTNAAIFARMQVDGYFASRIWRTWGQDIASGVCDGNDIQQRVRDFIFTHDIADQWINPKARPGRPRSTWRQVYERGYREKLA